MEQADQAVAKRESMVLLWRGGEVRDFLNGSTVA